MTTKSIFEVAEVVTLSKTKRKNISEVKSTTNLEDDLGFDSLDIVEITVDLERAIPGYGVKESDLCNIKTFGDLVSNIQPLSAIYRN